MIQTITSISGADQTITQLSGGAALSVLTSNAEVSQEITPIVVGTKGAAGVAGEGVATLLPRLEELETNIGDTDYNFREEINNFLSF